MLKDLLHKPFSETGWVVDSVHVGRISSGKKNDLVFPEVSITSSIGADKKTLWMAVTLRVFQFSPDTKTKTLVAELVAHAGYCFENDLQKGVAEDQEVIRHFGFPVYQRSSQFLETIFRSMDLRVTLPMAQQYSQSKQEKVN